MSAKYTTSEKDSTDILDSRYYGMIGIGCFLLLSYCAKLHMLQGNEASIMTSFEIGMVFTIVIKVMMNIVGMWPTTFHGYIEPSFNEEILLTHICMKWRIDNNLPKLEKLDAILKTLTEALNAKKAIDKRAEELASKEQEDIKVYKDLLKDENWKKMQILVSEVINLDSRMCYIKIQEEINQLRERDLTDEEEETKQ